MKKGHRDAKLLAIVVAALSLGAACDGPSEGPERGQALFGACVSCHGASGAGNPEVGAPAIAGLPAWFVESQLLKFKSGTRGTHPDDEAGMRMRPLSLTLRNEADVKNVAAWVQSLPRVPGDHAVAGGDAARGKALFATCMACHGPDGGGNQALNAPPLAGADDWYLLAQLKKFKSGARGADPKDALGAQMRAMVNTLTDEQAMKDVVAHIASLPAKGGS